MEANHDWSRFCKRISILANAQDIYNACTIPILLESWLPRKANFRTLNNQIREAESSIQKGDSYEWLWYGYSDEVIEKGRILEANGYNFIQFTFGDGGIVSIRVKKEKKMNLIELWQEDIPVDEDSRAYYHLGCSTGWTFYLSNLKSILEGGIDLRNKNQRVSNLINA